VLPAFCQFYDIKPWEIDRLTYREAERFLEHMNSATAAALAQLGL
jgi:hypothetical protein